MQKRGHYRRAVTKVGMMRFFLEWVEELGITLRFGDEGGHALHHSRKVWKRGGFGGGWP